MGYDVHDVLRKVVPYYIRIFFKFKNQFLVMIWNLSFLKKKSSLNLQGINTLLEIHIYSKIINEKMSCTWKILSIYY